MQAIVEDARTEDAERLADLAAQLGYPVDKIFVAQWIAKHAKDRDDRVLVAADDGLVVGWTSVSIADHFYTERCAEISGLVVDERYRGKGIGRLLLDEAGKWAVSKGLGTIRLRANVVRTEAHRFYLNLGFRKTKEQFVFVKDLRGV
jgi:GNAT superfamily N-acetyltransferase